MFSMVMLTRGSNSKIAAVHQNCTLTRLSVDPGFANDKELTSEMTIGHYADPVLD